MDLEVIVKAVAVTVAGIKMPSEIFLMDTALRKSSYSLMMGDEKVISLLLML